MAPLTLLCSPKIVTPRTKLHLKRSKFLDKSFKLRYCTYQELNQYWRYDQRRVFISFMILTILISKYCNFSETQRKFEISHFLSIFSKYIRYQDLQYFILMLLTRNFGHSKYNIALGVRILDLEDNISIHVFLNRLNVFKLYKPSEGQSKAPFVCIL